MITWKVFQICFCCKLWLTEVETKASFSHFFFDFSYFCHMFLFYYSPSKKVVSPFLPVLLILVLALLVILLLYLEISSNYL